MSLKTPANLSQTPAFTPDEAVKMAADHFGIVGRAAPLPGERDQNFLLESDAGERFVLKIANGSEDRALLDAQAEALRRAEPTGIAPQLLSTTGGAAMAQIAGQEDCRHWVRLLTFLPGTPLAKQPRQTPALWQDVGRRVAQVDAALADFDHPALHRNFHWDLAQGPAIVNEYSPLIADPTLRGLVEGLIADFHSQTAPLLPGLPRQVIHNDANDHNLLVGGGDDLYSRNQQVVGLIDFGDMVHSYRVGGLAVAVAYALLDKADPLAVAQAMTAGYHAVTPLTENEVAALWGLVRLRLCVSVCMAAHQQSQRPDDAYLGISQQPIRRTLPRLARIHPRFAAVALGRACGLTLWPGGERLAGWLTEQNFAPVIQADDYAVLDLSVGSPLVSGDPADNSAERLGARISRRMEEAGGAVGVGRYDEARLIYTAGMFGEAGEERRTIHLGMDLFSPTGTSICAPLDGVVHALADNRSAQDYGPVVILAHQLPQELGGEKFFTLYGHLSWASLAGLEVGQPIAAGTPFAALGSADENGGWPPHLHFQIITDLLELGTDFPGVGTASRRDVWKCLCPDPNLILGIPADNFPAPDPTKSETLAARRARIGGSLSIGYQEPVKVVRGWRHYLYDETGRRYLDAYNNVPHVGHCHPRVVRAAQEQMAVLNTNTRYLHDNINRLAEQLAATLPAPLEVCFFLNSASEANELALRLVRAHTGRREMIVLEGAYHGNTSGLIDISPYKHDGPGGRGAPDWVFTAPVADVYRGLFKADDPLAGAKYAAEVQATIARMQSRGRGLGGFIAESCPSVGGQIFFPPGYLTAVYGYVRAAGGLCIADEVQTGYGRIGTHFYAFEAQGVVPDVVVLGKPIGNGHPLAALVTTRAIADSFNNGMEFFSTFGGNPVSCAVGLAVLDVVQEEGLQAHARRVGAHLLAGLRPFARRFPLVGDVRGSGLFLGVELVRDRETLEPAADAASYVTNRMREEGILLGTDGPLHNVVKIRPPMPFTVADADRLVHTFERILVELMGG